MPHTIAYLVILAAFGGFIAGMTTTLAGIGGGIALVALLSTVLPPKSVIPLTAPVLLVGNITRVWLYRRQIDRPIITWFILGAVPATTVGALLLPNLPGRLLQVGLAILVLLFVTYQLNRRSRTRPARLLPTRLFTFVGAANGLVSAIAGGGGVVSAPFFYAHGLAKERFVGTSSAGGLSINGLKTVIFLTMGLLSIGNLPASLAAAIMVIVGNGLGRVLLGRISESLFRKFLLFALVAVALRLLIR